MNVSILSTLEEGGAANASLRLKKGLEQIGVNVTFISERFAAQNYNERVANSSNYFKLKMYFKKRNLIKSNFKVIQYATMLPDFFSFPKSVYSTKDFKIPKHPEIINLHWTSNFINTPEFYKDTSHLPMVITLHDMNYFTGGCHYSFHCNKFIDEQCNECFQLAKSGYAQVTKSYFKIKHKAYLQRKESNTIVVSPSNWLNKQSQRSQLFSRFKHIVIPNGIDTDEFKPSSREEARRLLGISYSGPILLFIASEINLYRKGFEIVEEILPLLNDFSVKVMIVGNLGDKIIKSKSVILIGKLTEISKIALCYSASNAMLLPTLADNFPNIMLESLACGTPVIGFNIGGLPDVIRNGENGYLSSMLNGQGLLEAISLFFKQGIMMDYNTIIKDCKEKYSLSIQANRYKDVFKTLNP